eukprot:TRINITY_DN11610_c0_g2_i3.p2 TRINITY_DN11610_c0_g2~~TRINITY_DN11610_c0_g2_i3.p2  ORF type:complete len:118 (+),score=24.56 TRINITY_DN11610_c0_g2_i3:158-511(+)
MVIPTFPENKSCREKDGDSTFAGQIVAVEGWSVPDLGRSYGANKRHRSYLKNPAPYRRCERAAEKKVRCRFRLSFTEAAVRGKVKTNSLGPVLGWSLPMKKSPSKKGDSGDKETVPN